MTAASSASGLDCPSCGEANPERARFCLACGTPLAAVAAPRREARKTVTIVFADIQGSTELGERLDPESVRRLMARYFADMRTALERHGGTVEKFIGDAVMAVFGIPTIHEDDALRAVRAAADMRRALGVLNEEARARWGIGLRMRIGVNTGEVVAGDPSQGQAFATGDTVNVAARLEGAAAPGEILIGAETERLVGDAAEVEAVEPLTLKGKAEPMPAFRLLTVGRRGGFRLGSPFVGRAAELGALHAAYESARDGRSCRLVTVLGEAGAGKSRLVHELVRGLGEEARVLRGRCLSYGEGITFWPVAEIVRAAAGLGEEDSADAAREAIARLLPDDEERAPILERVTALLGLDDVVFHAEDAFWAVRRLLEVLAARQPLVVVWDDVHWGERTFLDLLEYLPAASGDVPLLLVCMARPELATSRPRLGGPESLTLGPLDADESRELTANLLGRAEPPEGVLAGVAASAQGNPLFVEEMVRALVDDGLLERSKGQWQATRARPVVAVPASIQALLAARLDRLDEDERELIDRAAVIGQEFTVGAVAALGDQPAVVVAERLEALVAHDLLRPTARRVAGEPTLGFRHSLIREVAYAGLLKEARALLHERTADWLERATGERVREYEEILGYHLEAAHRYLGELGSADGRADALASRAAARLGGAGRRALAREDMPAAITLLERALALLPEDDPARPDLSLKLGIALAETGELDRADALLGERIEAARQGKSMLVYRDGAGAQQVLDLEGTIRLTVGRRRDNDLALTWDTQVSRSHAAFECGPEGWAVVDVGPSRNGCYVNGERLHGRRFLRDGDMLRFGDTIVLYRAPARAAPRPLVAAPSGITTIRPTARPHHDLPADDRSVLLVVARAVRLHTDGPGLTARVAAELGLSAEEISRRLLGLARSFALDHLGDEAQRRLLVERAIASGALDPAELEPRQRAQ